MRPIFLLLLLSPIFLHAQTTDTLTGSILKDKIIDRFNKKAFKEIYIMADSSFKASVTEEQIVSLLTSASSLGNILSAELINTENQNQQYRLYFEKKSLLLNLTPSSPASYSSFGMSYYKLPAVRTRKHFLSDNILQSPLDSLVQDAVTTYMSNKNIAGLAIGVYENGKTSIYNYGETKKGNGRLPEKNTIYEIGSITKTFTGQILANAVLEGKVKLDDDIRKYLPGNYPNLSYAGRPIRLVNLSNHTSGLPSQPKVPATNEDPFSPAIKFNDAMLADILQVVHLDTLPGITKQYSNFGVGLLGNILEQVYQMDYDQLVKKYISDPYQMNDTKVVLHKNDFVNYAQGYGVEGNETQYWYNKLAEPAGGIRSTIHDMLLFIKGQLNTTDKAAQLTHQLTFGDVKEGNGLGWGIYTTKKGYLRWAHDGGTDGFTSIVLIFPEINAGIILLTNTGDHDDQSFFDIGTKIYNSIAKPK
jgi:CubicO group peptidase (beta-lactamase class C family)